MFARRTAGAGFLAGAESLVHDPLDGAGTASALGAAAEATINLASGARLGARHRHGGADILVGEHVAGADDHGTVATRYIRADR